MKPVTDTPSQRADAHAANMNEILRRVVTSETVDEATKYARQLVEAADAADPTGKKKADPTKGGFGHARAQLLAKMAAQPSHPGGASTPIPASKRGA